MTQHVGGAMMVLVQGWASVCLVGMLAQTSPVSVVLQVDGSSQNAQVSHAAYLDFHSQSQESYT
jgi:hypothetical protein